MEAVLVAMFDLIRGLLSASNLWGALALATTVLTLTLLGAAARIVLWLETLQYRNEA